MYIIDTCMQCGGEWPGSLSPVKLSAHVHACTLAALVDFAPDEGLQLGILKPLFSRTLSESTGYAN